MKILLKNLGRLPYSLDIGEFDSGMVRPLLAIKDTPGDTVDIGDRVDPWDLNVQKFVRSLVVPKGSVAQLTNVPGGYRIVGNPVGVLSVTFIQEADDLVFLFNPSSGGGGESSWSRDFMTMGG